MGLPLVLVYLELVPPPRLVENNGYKLSEPVLCVSESMDGAGSVAWWGFSPPWSAGDGKEDRRMEIVE